VRRRDVGMSSEQFYRYRVRAFGTGTMDLRVEKRAGGVNTWITSYTRIPAVWEAGGRYWIRWDCLESGSGTVIHMRVWRDGEAEPADWQIAKMENEPALAAGGVVGFRVAAPSADQVNFPITFAFDDFKLFTLVAPNTAPVADPGGPYVGVSGSPVGFDGSQSSDADNDVPLTYHWDFGDGSTSEEMAPNHTYAAAGTYAVTLTVTDSRGLDSEPATTSATIEENDPSVLVTDHFSRTVSDGWGTAEVGGSWLIDPWLRPDFRVNGTEGQIVAPDIGSRNVVPTDGYGLNVTGVASYIIDKAPDDPTGFHTVQVYARRDDSVTDGDNYYRYRVRNFGSGKVDLRVEKNVNGVLTWLLPDSKTVAAVFAPGKKFWIRWECTGTSPATVLRMRLWPDGSAEPSTWAMEVTVNEPALDVTGTTGFRVKTSNTNQVTFPITFSFDNLEYRLKE
jgi:PKD repeat protein